jgi:hypothetical protein
LNRYFFARDPRTVLHLVGRRDFDRPYYGEIRLLKSFLGYILEVPQQFQRMVKPTVTVDAFQYGATGIYWDGGVANGFRHSYDFFVSCINCNEDAACPLSILWNPIL